jgi:tetratricopeptide (TPR) repeat protein
MLKSRADQLLATYMASRSMTDLEGAIGIYEETLHLRSVGHEQRAQSLNDLGNAFFHFCWDHGADETRSNRCVELLREALRLRPPGHPLRDESLHDLAKSLHFLIYPQLGSLDILMECAALNREALTLRPPDHPKRMHTLNNMAIDLSDIVEHTGDLNMLGEMVSIHRKVLRMSPPGHPVHLNSLQNLGIALSISFERLGRSELLAESISLLREAIHICPIGHPQRFSVLDSLAYALSLRSIYHGHSESLLESISLSRKALGSLSDNHPKRAGTMTNFADSLLASFRTSGDESLLVEAIGLLREAVILRSSGEHAHDTVLNTLAEALEAQHVNNGDTEALSEAVDLHREALQLQPMGHCRRWWSLEGLARVLCRVGSSSCPEALSCYQQALELCPLGYPARARLLSGMSKCLLNPSSPLFSLDKGISCLSEAFADTFSHVSGRLKLAIPDLRELEVAVGATTRGDHSDFHSREDAMVLSLYAQVISLLPLAANFGLDDTGRLQALIGCDEIARNAAARAVLLGCLSQAVQMLEQGRGVFWMQTLHLRTTAFDGAPDNECQELQRMLRLLEHGARHVEVQDQSTSQQERELEKRRQLNEAVQALINKIRGYPGLDRFLLPPAFDTLLGSLPDGFVVILNASKLGHHALLLQRTTGLAKSLVLEPFTASFDFAKLRAQLPRDMDSVSQSNVEADTRAMRLNNGRVGDLIDLLSLLWTSIGLPVLETLGLHVSNAMVYTCARSDRFIAASAGTRSAEIMVVRDRGIWLLSYPCCWEVP